MSIAPLPSQTTRLLGSAQVVTSPCSIVKELIDNAIDARASAIFVEVSLNCLDIIHVRDNGHGVLPDDRKLLCRRYCTSKIRDYAEINQIGGTYFGFRGEALSSMAEVCGELAVTTRVEGELAAVTLHFNRDGSIRREEIASHPSGTAVRVVDLFRALPVRKQAAQKPKAVEKMLVSIKQLLQSYAFARLSVRFSLKILKAKDDNSNWTFVPKPSQDVADVALKIVGKNCASQCRYEELEYSGFKIQAFLPRADATALHISHIGAFISVDSRPVSKKRGTLKEVWTTFKDKLKASSPSLLNVMEPFLWMNIKCPTGSYDPNVEPAKDDVCFENPKLVLDAIKALLDRCYPTPIVDAAIRGTAINLAPTLEGSNTVNTSTAPTTSSLPTDSRPGSVQTMLTEIFGEASTRSPGQSLRIMAKRPPQSPFKPPQFEMPTLNTSIIPYLLPPNISSASSSPTTSPDPSPAHDRRSSFSSYDTGNSSSPQNRSPMMQFPRDTASNLTADESGIRHQPRMTRYGLMQHIPGYSPTTSIKRTSPSIAPRKRRALDRSFRMRTSPHTHAEQESENDLLTTEMDNAFMSIPYPAKDVLTAADEHDDNLLLPQGLAGHVVCVTTEEVARAVIGEVDEYWPAWGAGGDGCGYVQSVLEVVSDEEMEGWTTELVRYVTGEDTG